LTFLVREGINQLIDWQRGAGAEVMWDSTAAENSLTVAQIFEFLDGGREDVLADLVHPKYVNPETKKFGIEGITSGRERLRATFGREARVLVQAVIAEGDEVAVRWKLRGLEHDEPAGAPSSERPVELSALSMFRLEDGLVVESWQETGAPMPVGAVAAAQKSRAG
jgi:predicted ester cyclase